MRILIITTKRISSTQIKEFNRHYSVLSISKQHLKKSIHQLGSSELVLCNLNFGVLHTPSKNDELKWINSQDLSAFKTVYIYSKPKYMKSFVKSNLVMKSLPVVVGKTLEAVLAMSERLADGESSVSLTQEDLKSITEEVVKTEITPDDIIKLMGDYKQLQKDYVELERTCERLRESAVKVLREPDPEPPVFHNREDNIESLELNSIIAKLQKQPVKPVKSVNHIKDGFELIKDGKIIDILKYTNRREQRTAQKTAMRWVRE